MKTFDFKLIATLMLSAFLLTCCNSISKKSSDESKSIAEKAIGDQDIQPEIEKLLYEFPTPFELTIMLNDAKAAFIFSITNPVENLEKYMTEKTQALNLGVYSADLSYAATYNQSDEIVKLMECTSKLSDELGISGIYNQNLVEIVKENYNNQDSLVRILTQVFNDTKNYLSKANRDKVTLFIASGGFIESLYIAANLNALTDKNQEITKVIYKQEETLDKLLDVMEAFSYDTEIEVIRLQMVEVKTFFSNNPLTDGVKLSDEKATELKNTVEQIRNGLAK